MRESHSYICICSVSVHSIFRRVRFPIIEVVPVSAKGLGPFKFENPTDEIEADGSTLAGQLSPYPQRSQLRPRQRLPA
jgi:hypothetical protein